MPLPSSNDVSPDQVRLSDTESQDMPVDSDSLARRRVAPKAVRRAQLIEATITSIARHGLSGTTMSSVTEIAGLSIGLVNFHFKSKQNLFEQTLLQIAQEHHDHWQSVYRDAGAGAAEKLAAIVAAHFHPSICTSDRIAIWFAFFGDVEFRALYRALLDPIDTEREEISVALINQIVAEGGYDLPSARDIARTLEALYDGQNLNIMMYPEAVTPQQAQDQIMAYLAGLFPTHFTRPL